MCLRLTTCCCCCDLTKGVKIIAWIGIIGAILGLMGNLNMTHILSTLFSLGLSGCLWYGADRRKSAFLIIYLVFSGIGIALTGLFFGLAVILFFLRNKLWKELEEIFEEMSKQQGMQHIDSYDEETTKTTITIFLVFMMILTMIYLLVACYCFAIIYSLHKEIQEEHGKGLINGDFQSLEKGSEVISDKGGYPQKA